MSVLRHRYAKSGITTSIVLMFCIVVFLGSLFWLLVDASFLFGDTENGLFDPKGVTDNTPPTLKETISALQGSGCLVTHYMRDYKEGSTMVSHEELLENGVKTKLIYIAINFNNTTVLLVETGGSVLEWVPEG